MQRGSQLPSPPTWSMIRSKAKYSTKNLQLCFIAAPYLLCGQGAQGGEGSGMSASASGGRAVAEVQAGQCSTGGSASPAPTANVQNCTTAPHAVGTRAAQPHAARRAHRVWSMACPVRSAAAQQRYAWPPRPKSSDCPPKARW